MRSGVDDFSFPARTDRLTVYRIQEPRLRTASVCLSVAYGSRHDPVGYGGLAHLLEHLLMSAPLDGGPSFCEHVERLGGHVNAETGLEQMLFYAQVHADDVDETVEALCRAVRTPEWSADLLDRERAIVLEELTGAAADPSDAVQDAILSALFGGHPLGRPVGGSAAEVRATSTEVLDAHHSSNFLGRPMALVVVAPTLPDDKWTANHAVGLPPIVDDEQCVPLPPVAGQAPRWPDEYAWVCLGSRSPSRLDDRRHSYQLLATLLGGSPASLLFRRLRGEQGLAYSFHAWDRGYTEAGALRLLVGVDKGNGDRVVTTVREVLTDIADGDLSDDDLQLARCQAEMQVILDMDNPLALAKMVATRTHAGTVGWSARSEAASLRETPLGSVVTAAQDLLHNMVAVVRPEA